MIKVEKEQREENLIPKSSEDNFDRLSSLLEQLQREGNKEEEKEPEYPLGEIPDELVKLNENLTEPEPPVQPESKHVKAGIPVKKVKKKHDGKSGKKKGPSAMAIILIIAGVVAACLAVGLIIYRNITTYQFKEDAVYFVNGMEFDISAGSRAKMSRDGVVSLQRKDDTGFPLKETGVFFKKSCKMLTVVPMSYYRANQGGNYTGAQVSQLTEVSCEYGNTTFEKEGKTFTQQGEFLYDGKNTYIALGKAELSVGDKVLAELSPLSYVICVYQSWVAYWDHDTGKYEFVSIAENENRDVILSFKEDHVNVLCDQDRVVKGEESFMLTSAVTMLDDILK